MKQRTHLSIIRKIADLLDNKFSFLGYRFGLDPVIGLVPGIGDIIPFMLGIYMIWIARDLELPGEKVMEMIRNIIIDAFLGIIPVVGDLSDFVFRAYSKNLAIIESHIAIKGIDEDTG